MPPIEFVLDYIPSLSNIVLAHDPSVENRAQYCIGVDKKFIQIAFSHISNHKAQHQGTTLIIVNTGHSIPIGLSLFQKGYDLQWCHTKPLKSPATNPSSHRLTTQIRHFADLCLLRETRNIEDSVLLGDAHLDGVLDVINTHLPDEVALAAYSNILYLTEAKFTQRYEGYNGEHHLPKNFLELCEKLNIGLHFRGCDYDRELRRGLFLEPEISLYLRTQKGQEEEQSGFRNFKNSSMFTQKREANETKNDNTLSKFLFLLNDLLKREANETKNDNTLALLRK